MYNHSMTSWEVGNQGKWEPASGLYTNTEQQTIGKLCGTQLNHLIMPKSWLGFTYIVDTNEKVYRKDTTIKLF